jgi:hypothetical protein
MRYYPSTSDITSFYDKLSDFQCRKEVSRTFLTTDGLYKYIDDVLMVYKLELRDDENLVLKKYINNTDFYVTNNKWRKAIERFQLPVVHEITDIKTYTFSPRPKSRLKFIVEKMDDRVTDYYFVSSEQYDNHSIKEDMCLFLNKLK